MTVWITLSSGLKYRVNGNGRKKNPVGNLSTTEQARKAAGERKELLNAEHAERASMMVEMYRSGQTLDGIGKLYGVSRERVRQIITKAGAKGFGQAARAAAALAKKNAKEAGLDAACMAKYGVSRDEWKSLSRDGIIHRYRHQRHSARSRGILWELTLLEWLAIWRDSGKLNERGRGKDKYCMTRIGDQGPYKLGNVVIKTNSENASEGIGSRPRVGKKWRGIFLSYPGLSRPWVAQVQGSQIGRYATQEEAVNARAAFMLERGIKDAGVGRGRGWTLDTRNKARPYYMQGPRGARGYFATAEEARAAYLDACAAAFKDSA